MNQVSKTPKQTNADGAKAKSVPAESIPKDSADVVRQKKDGTPARWPLAITGLAWLAWVVFLFAMMLSQRGGAGPS